MEIIDQKYTVEKAIELSNDNKVIPFWKPYGDYGYLCQWHKTTFYDDTYTYNCAEQYMMVQKALLFNDMEIIPRILKEDVPANIRLYGREIKNFNQEVWDKYKFTIVYNGNLLKFTQNKWLMNFLKNTGNNILVEASPYDGVWGVKLYETSDNINYPEKWNGENLLGFALMQVRDNL